MRLRSKYPPLQVPGLWAPDLSVQRRVRGRSLRPLCRGGKGCVMEKPKTPEPQTAEVLEVVKMPRCVCGRCSGYGKEHPCRHCGRTYSNLEACPACGCPKAPPLGGKEGGR